MCLRSAGSALMAQSALARSMKNSVTQFLILDKLVTISFVSLSASISRRLPGEHLIRKHLFCS